MNVEKSIKIIPVNVLDLVVRLEKKKKKIMMSTSGGILERG